MAPGRRNAIITSGKTWEKRQEKIISFVRAPRSLTREIRPGALASQSHKLVKNYNEIRQKETFSLKILPKKSTKTNYRKNS